MVRHRKKLHRRYIDNRKRKYERKLYNLFDQMIVWTTLGVLALIVIVLAWVVL